MGFAQIMYNEEELQKYMMSFGGDMKPVIVVDYTESFCTRLTIMESDDPYLPFSLIPIIATRENTRMDFTAYMDFYSLSNYKGILMRHAPPR